MANTIDQTTIKQLLQELETKLDFTGCIELHLKRGEFHTCKKIEIIKFKE